MRKEIVTLFGFIELFYWHIPYYILRISSFMILICLGHGNLRHLRAIFLA